MAPLVLIWHHTVRLGLIPAALLFLSVSCKRFFAMDPQACPLFQFQTYILTASLTLSVISRDSNALHVEYINQIFRPTVQLLLFSAVERLKTPTSVRHL